MIFIKTYGKNPPHQRILSREEYNRFRYLIASVIYEINQVVDEATLNQNLERLQALRKEAKGK